MMISLLSQLSDDDPSTARDLSEPNTDLNKELLMVLTSRPQSNIPDDLSSLQATIVGYGLQCDFSFEIEASQKSQMLSERIRQALDFFEPRLSSMTVETLPSQTSSLLFQIDAVVNDESRRFILSWDDVTGLFILR